MYSIDYHAGIDGGKGILVEATMDHLIRSRPSRGELMAAPAGKMMIE